MTPREDCSPAETPRSSCSSSGLRTGGERRTSSWRAARNGRTTATRRSPYAHFAPSSRPSTDGVSRSPGSREHPPAGARHERESDKMVPSANTVDLDRRLLNSQLVLYPDAGHGGVFQFHEDFVQRALAFLSESSWTRS